MDKLREKSDRLLGSVQLDFQRDLLRETFLFTQLQGRHHLSLPKRGDFFIDDTVTLEVGGAGNSKTEK